MALSQTQFGGNQLHHGIVHKTDSLSSYNGGLKLLTVHKRRNWLKEKRTQLWWLHLHLCFQSVFDGIFGNVNSGLTHQDSWQYKSYSQKHFLDSYSNPGPSHHQGSKEDLLKGSKDIDNKNSLSWSIKLKSCVCRAGHMKDNYNLRKHVSENKARFLQLTSPLQSCDLLLL